MIAETIYSLLKNDTTISSIVSTDIYPDILPQSKSTGIVYQMIGEEEIDTVSQPDTLIGAIYQFTCISSTRFVANQIADAVRDLFKNYSTSPINATEKLGRIEETLDEKTYTTILDYQIWYQESEV